MKEIITTQHFERRNYLDNQLYASIPVGTKIKVEEFGGQYEVIADIKITKNGDFSIFVSKTELEFLQAKK